MVVLCKCLVQGLSFLGDVWLLIQPLYSLQVCSDCVFLCKLVLAGVGGQVSEPVLPHSLLRLAQSQAPPAPPLPSRVPPACS